MTSVCGPAYRPVLTETLGADVVERSEQHCGYFFGEEVRALDSWSYEPATAPKHPVLLITGADSPPPVHRIITRLASIIPGANTATIAHADRLLPLTKSLDLSRAIANFCRWR